jgi:hypothetical protein
MLRLMGWKEGEALGQRKQGLVDPIKAECYAKGTGLGAGVPFTADELVNMSQKDQIKKKSKIRFQLTK